MYRPDHFELYELVPEEEYNHYGERLWNYFDPNILKAQDLLAERFGTCTVNNWKLGGNLSYRGYRPPSCTFCGELSAHRLFKALDSSFKTATAEEVRQYLIDTNGLNGLVTRIEMPKPGKDMLWVHIDTVYTGSSDLVIFYV